ncbi:M16 family metallopeptidase [Mucilaginibacter terrae]|uniref:Zinc protease n=1 Tax=Mucilaginibacter terrae TaxID=1955052 RepID=A0ABU3GX32_9SPHI|nr:pitrilysin family protein [Mucilaginibacter terrae]MDT3404327.1 zinc protease [Mucilaginibacter terrae]
MKKIFITLTAACLLQTVYAQVDRNRLPAPGPAPVISIKDPVTYKLPNGITLLVVEDHKLPQVSASFYVDAGPVFEGKKAGVYSLMGQMLNEGTTVLTKAQFDEAVDKLGADVNLSASGGNVNALTRYFPEAFALMSQAIQKPAFKNESFEKLRSQTLTGIKSNERNVKAVSGQVVKALLYGKKSPMGEFVTEETVKGLTLADIKATYAKYITPSRSYLTIIGDIKPADAKKLVDKAFLNWKGAPLTLPVLANAANPVKTEVDVIDMPNAVQSEITVTNLINLKMSDPDFFAVKLANVILGGGSEAYLFKSLREKRGFTYGAYSQVGSGRFQTSFSATAAVRTAKTDSAINEFVTQINRMRNEPVTAEDLKNAKAMYNGSFALGMEDASNTASYARNILINGLPKDYYRTYLQKLNAVTAADVQRVAKKYFNTGNTRVIVVGNASQFMDGVKKLPYPVKMYDRNADPVVEGAAAPVLAGIKASTVFSDYITASGGAAELKKIKTITITSSMQMQGMPLSVQQKYMAPNWEMMTLSMNGNVVVKSAFNGTVGYQTQMGNKTEMTAAEIKDKNAITGLFEQLDYLSNPAFKSEVKGVEKINGANAYKVAITSPTGKISTEYYDVTSKLLVRKESTETKGTATTQTTTDLGSYKKVGAIMFPFAQTLTISAGGQQQVLEMKVSDVKFNEGVTAEDFK